MEKCLHCDGAVEPECEFRPFCSARCKDVDLGKWFGEEYVVSRPMLVDEVQSVFSDSEDTSD